MILGEPELGPARRATVAVLAAGLVGLAFASGIVAVPWLEARGVSGATVLRGAYAPLCHQLAQRSLTLGDRPLAVCARCTGLYVGAVVGLLAAVLARRMWVRPNPWWLAVAFAPTIIDFGVSWLALGGLANLPRALLAVPAGAMAGVFLSIGIRDLFESRSGGGRGGVLVPRAAREG